MTECCSAELSGAAPAGTFQTMRKGIAVSPGVAIGRAYCIHEIFVNPDTKRLEDREVTAELAGYETARDKTAADLRALQPKVEAQVGREEAAIFAVHESILHDAAFTKKIRDLDRRRTPHRPGGPAPPAGRIHRRCSPAPRTSTSRNG